MPGRMIDRLVLAFDTSFGPVSAALAKLDGTIIASAEANNPAGTQAETLPPLVAHMFKGVGAEFRQLTRVAVTVGPGAFTGVRVGLAFAKGINLATGAEILGLSTLECLAVQVQTGVPKCSVGVAIDAKRGEVYAFAIDSGGDVILPGALMSIDDAMHAMDRVLQEPSVLTGSGAQLLQGAVCDRIVIDAGRIDAKLMAARAGTLAPCLHPPAPAYLRAPDARLPI